LRHEPLAEDIPKIGGRAVVRRISENDASNGVLALESVAFFMA
jgi:hypothetical protein